ncbi:MAG: DUF86 domain-containing protein [Armatimonadota bacterium]|nr:DUF86 domain-containing protein [Armatimonadota bacterium]
MPVDRDIVQRKITLIAEDLLRLQPFARLPLEDYLARTEVQLATERLLERVIGRMLDINYHLAVELGGVAPRDFHDSFLKLVELGILPAEFARRIARAAGLRNRLAHEYNDLDAAKVHEAAAGTLADVPVYLDDVQQFLDRMAIADGP